MSRMGMNLPGSMRQAKPDMDIYTALLFFAVLALAAACVMLFVQGSAIGKDGSAFGLQQGPDASGKSNITFGS